MHTLASLFAIQPEVGAIGSALALFTGQLEPAIKSLLGFAGLPDPDLYALALKLAGSR